MPTASQPSEPSALRARTAAEGADSAVAVSNGGRAMTMYSHAAMCPFLRRTAAARRRASYARTRFRVTLEGACSEQKYPSL